MIVFPQFAFAAPPFTGADWFLEGCPVIPPGPAAAIYKPFPAKYNERYTLSMVRHPLTWLHAYFVAEPRLVHVPEIDLFHEMRRGSQGRFETFVAAYLQNFAGSISRMFQAYRAATVMKYEDMPYCGAEFLESIGHGDAAVKLQNCSHSVDVVGWMQNRDLRWDIVRAEEMFCCDYCYY